MIKIICILALLNNNIINVKYSYSPKTNVISSFDVGIKPFVVGDIYFMEQQDLFKEVYKPINGYENYKVSNFGNVVNTTKKGKKYPMKMKQLNNGSDMRVGLSKDGVRIRVNVSRLVAEHFIENPNNHKYVKKLDGNIYNNHVNNLFWTNNSIEDIIDITGTFTCVTCNTNKLKFYFKDKKNKTGYSYRKTCSECCYKKRKEKYGVKIQEYRDVQHFKEQTTIEGRASLLLNRCKRRARIYGKEINITYQDILELLSFKECKVTGIPLVINRDKPNPFSPSVDRIDNKKGYIKSNIQITCYIYNMCKNLFKDEDVVDFVTKFYNNKLKHV